MAIRVVFGTANMPLAAAIAAHLGSEPVSCTVERFPDGELRPAVGEVRGEDVYVVQPTGRPVNDNVVELLLLLDACRRAGAERVTAVIPYFGYARQDRRGVAGEAVGARVVADALAAGADRLIVVDPHTAALEAMCAIPVEMLTAVPVLAAALEPILADSSVIVAPDLGAVKLAERYALRLGRRPVAVVRKTRMSGEQVEAHELVGDVAGRPAVIIDDMISTGATIEAAVAVALVHGAASDLVVAATHGLLVAGAMARMSAAGVRRVLITDTLDAPSTPGLEVCSIAALLADAIGRLHRNERLDDLLMHT